MAATHRFEAQLAWTGSTAVGYHAYGREHTVTTAAGTTPLSADEHFRGDPSRLNPEQLLLAAASSCQLLSYLALAARAGLDVVGYTDAAEASMPVTTERMRITTIVLRPHIVLGPGTDRGTAQQLVHEAHDSCYIANTISAEIVVEATIEVAAG